MKTRILLAAVLTSLGSHVAFAQMGGGYGGGMTQGQPAANGDRSQQTTTTTKTTTPMSVKNYLDNQIASSKDKKFHLTFEGKDVALTPVKFREEKKLGGGKSSTPVDMKGADGKLYEVDFVSSGGQLIGAKIHKSTATP